MGVGRTLEMEFESRGRHERQQRDDAHVARG